jgi:calcium-dependent protein kinase
MNSYFSVRLEEVYEMPSEHKIYLVEELCLGGDLFDRLFGEQSDDQSDEYVFTEAECARLMKNMLDAVRYIHSKGIIHR